MLKAISILALVMISGLAKAQPVYPHPDGMSVYFDEVGMDYCLSVDDWVPAIWAGPTISAYLIVTRPSTPLPYIQGWEAQIEIMSNSYLLPPAWTLTPGAVNIGKEPGDYIVDAGGAASIPITSDSVLLASIELVWLGFEGHAEARISMYGVPGSQLHPEGPGYHSDEAATPISCRCFFGSWGPVAWVNGDCGFLWPRPSIDEDLTWGEVKSLY